MEAEEITELFRRLESTANKCEGVECRSARELPTQLGHAKWERFCDVTDKAKEACLNAGENPEGHFPTRGKWPCWFSHLARDGNRKPCSARGL